MRPGPGIMSMLPERKPRPPRQFISPLGPSDRPVPTPMGLNPDGTPYVSSLPSAAPGVPMGPDGTPGPANIPEVVEKAKQVLPSLPPKALQEVVPKIPPQVIKEVIPSLPPQTIKEVLPLCGTEVVREVMPTLPPQVIKEVVPSLPPEVAQEVIPTLPPEVAQEVVPPRRPMDADRPIGPRPPGRIPGGHPIRIPEPVGPMPMPGGGGRPPRPPFDPNLGQPPPDVQTAVDNMGWDIPGTTPGGPTSASDLPNYADWSLEELEGVKPPGVSDLPPNWQTRTQAEIAASNAPYFRAQAEIRRREQLEKAIEKGPYANIPGFGEVFSLPSVSGTSRYVDASGNSIPKELTSEWGRGRHGELYIPKEYRTTTDPAQTAVDNLPAGTRVDPAVGPIPSPEELYGEDWDMFPTPETLEEDFMPPMPPGFDPTVEHDIPEVQPPTTPIPEPFIPPEVLNPDGTPPWVDPIETAPDGGPPGGPPIGPTTVPPVTPTVPPVTPTVPPVTPTVPPVTPETTPVQGMTMEEMQKMIADMQAQQQAQAAARAAQEAEMSKQYMVYGDRTGYNPYQSGQYQSDPYGPSGVPNMGGITTIPVPGGYGIHNPVYERLRRKI